MVMTQDSRTNLVCHRQVESMLLWPERCDAKRSTGVQFSLWPPQAGRDVIEDADWHAIKVDRTPMTLQPIRFRCEKSVTCYVVEPSAAEKRYKSMLQLAIPPRSLRIHDNAQAVDVTNGEQVDQRPQRFKRGIEVSHRYKS